MRDWLYQKVSGFAGVTSHVPSARIYSAGSAGLQANTPRPFAVVKMQLESAGVGRVTRQTFQVWFHDAPGSVVAHIDPCILALKQGFAGLTMPVLLPGGRAVVAVDWIDNSPDFFDDGFGTITRYGTYQLVAGK